MTGITLNGDVKLLIYASAVTVFRQGKSHFVRFALNYRGYSVATTVTSSQFFVLIKLICGVTMHFTFASRGIVCLSNDDYMRILLMRGFIIVIGIYNIAFLHLSVINLIDAAFGNQRASGSVGIDPI